MRRRKYHHVEIDPAADQYDHGDSKHDPFAPFAWFRQKDKKGDDPIQENAHEHHWAPGAMGSPDKIGGLFWNIGIPDQHVLAEPDVDPETTKPEE